MSTKSKRKRARAPKAEPVAPVVDVVADVVADAPPAETAVAQADASQDESACASVAAPAAEPEVAATVAPAAEPEVIAEAAPAPESTVSAPESNAGPTIGLASNCTVKDAASFRNELLQLLDEPGSVAIDAKSVERIDTAIMQLLCAFVCDRSQRNASVTWVGVPQPLFDAARLLGVGALLALPQEATP